ncbi:MAG: hypothetical protein IJA86_06375 [Clostridia bacterium]|nr:hypothetical protein [Clostridia bacterium]
MAECSKSKVTVIQLFFLSFSYVFSGLFLIREHSFLSLLLPLGSAFLFSFFGFLFLQCAPRRFTEKERFLYFLSCGKPHWTSKVLMGFLIFLSAAEMLLTWLLFAFSVHSFSSFVSFSSVAVLILLLSLFIGAHGLTALGRFSELFVFLIAPLLFRIVFRKFETVDFSAFSRDLYALLTVTPAPLFYLFSMTVSESTTMPKPIRKLFVIPILSFFGAVLAVVCAFLFLLFGAGDKSIFFLLFGWMASIIRLSLLISVCTADRSPISLHRMDR